MYLRRPVSLILGVLALALLLRPVELRSNEAAEPKFTPAQVEFFEKQVLPILQAHCFKCHGEEKDKGGLRLNSRGAILKGGDTGTAVTLDKPADSLLVKAINYQGNLEMPPKGKLAPKEIAILTQWVKDGLPFTPGSAGPVVHKGMQITDKERSYWSYRPNTAPAVPTVKNKEWVRNPVDAFLLAKLEAKGLTPAQPADRIALVRRVFYDLTGLPPKPEEVEAFVNDKNPDAYEKLLDKLLASPQYGEKWGRHWLDLVRYAETNGYERDSAKPAAYRYRDYVIKSFNDDKPYDQFIKEQLAGDELDKVTTETLTATGYYRLGIWDDEPADRLQAKYDVFDDIVSTTSQVMLGMTVGCARCHDHKKDPIPQRDYYRLLAFFHDIADMNGRNLRKVATDADRVAIQAELKKKQETEGKLYAALYQIEQEFLLGLEKKGIQVSKNNADLEDLSYRFYRDTWEQLPDFDNLKHEASGRIADNRLSLAPASRQEAIGLVFEGKLKVPAKGEYTFFVESTEGVRLLIDGKKVIDQPAKGNHTAEAKQQLAAGLVPFRLEYFNGYAKPKLQVAWSGPAVEKRNLTATADRERVLLADARVAAQEWRYTTEQPGRGWNQSDFKDAGWKKGAGGFGQRGTPGALVKTEWTSNDIWLRRSFDLQEMPTNLVLNLHHDEDVQVYLNGVLVYRATGFLVNYARLPLGPEAIKALKTGANVLAVHCTQRSGGQYIDAGLVAAAQANLQTLLPQQGEAVLGAEKLRRYRELTAQLDASQKAKPVEPGAEVMCVEERGRTPAHLLVRGSAHVKGDVVTAGVPEVLVSKPIEVPDRYKTATSSGKRRVLAEWLTNKENPVPARVFVNRLWHYHFGRGLVASTNDFGKLGEGVTHPELLDWLAQDFVAHGFQIKRMHKLLLMTNAYQMSAKANATALRVDPANLLFWRANMRRLSAEEVRDSMLAVSGQLNLKMGGPSIYVEIPRDVLAGQSVPGSGWGKSAPDDQVRRSIYIHVKRSLQVPILATHDQADTDSSCAVRYTTTVPTQALGMLNGAFTNEQAQALATRLEKDAPNDSNAQVKHGIRLTTGRTPTDAEIGKDVAFLKELQSKDKLSATQALKQYCLLLLNANEFVYID